MRLRRLDLIRYGKFTDHTIDFGAKPDGGPDLHIIYGLNEAGKSTTLSGFVDLLFGIEERSRYGFLHQYSTMELGAALEFGGRQHEVRRVKQRGTSLRDPAGQPVGEGLLGGAVAGLTRDSYRMMFSLDDQTLEDGGNAILDSKGDLGELLFSASAGLAGLSRALAVVAGEADGLYRKKASSTEIALLKRRLADLKTKRDELDTQASAHAGLVAGLKAAEQAYDGAAAERGALKARHDDLAGLIRAAPLAADHARLSQELAGLADLPRPPRHWMAELPDLMTADATLRTRLAGLDDRSARLRDEREAITVDGRLLRLAERIEALPAASARYQTAEADLPKRRAALSESRARLVALARSVAGEDAEPDELVVDPPVLGTLRDLIEQWSGIESRLEAAVAEAAVADASLHRAQEERAALDKASPPLDPSTRAALHSALLRLRDGDLLARQRVATRTAGTKAQAVTAALRGLAPWLGAAEALASLPVPSPRQMQLWRDALADHDLRRSRHAQQRRELVTTQRELMARIASAEATSGLIGDHEAAALRDGREDAWATHKRRLDRESAARFEHLMRANDTMAEARLAGADRLAELRALRRDAAVLDARLVRDAELLAEVEAEAETLAAIITRESPAGIAGDRTGSAALGAIEAWLAHRDRALAVLEEQRDAEAERDGLEAEIAGESRRLALASQAAGLDVTALDLAAQMQAVDMRLAADASDTQARSGAEKAVREAVRMLEARRKAVEAAAAQQAAWEARWATVLSGGWLARHAGDRGAVRAVIDAVAGLPARLAERDGILHRIASMEEDRAHFLAELAALHDTLGEALDPLAATPAARGLLDRLQAVGQAQALRRGKEDELAAIARERATLLATLAEHDARRAEILAFFGLDDLASVSARLDRCAHRDRLEEEHRKLASRIMGEIGAATLEAALARLGGEDGAERGRAQAECAQRLDDVEARLRELYAKRTNAKDRLDAVGGDDAVARLEADRRTVMLQIEDRAVRYLHLRTGGLLADRALQLYRDKHRGSMMRRASEAFRAITRDHYAGLATRPEKDRETLIGLPKAGGSKLATDMSKGTRFQLYLALRLAGYEEFAATRPAVPFLADDIMETFDEPRSAEVLGLFGRLSTLGQVIYFTHHRHLCDLARAVVPDVQVHDLPS